MHKLRQLSGVHDQKLWEGQVLCSGPERGAFRQLIQAGLCDIFCQFDQVDGLFSGWDYRMAAFRCNLGLRIDRVLASPALCAVCTACQIDKTLAVLGTALGSHTGDG